MAVDNDSMPTIRINLNITLYNCPCMITSLD